MRGTSRDIENALVDLPAQASAAIAVRAALRVLPVQGRLDLRPEYWGSLGLIGCTLLCCRLAKFLTIFPHSATAGAIAVIADLTTRAADQADGTAFASYNFGPYDDEEPTEEQLAREKAYGHASAAARAAAAAARTTINVGGAAAKAVHSAIFAECPGATINEDVRLLRGVPRSPDLLPSGLTSADLLALPLWHDGVPRYTAQLWERLKSGLLALNMDFDIWVEWYEQQIEGHRTPLDTDLERRLLLSKEQLNQSVAKVNAHLKSIIRGDASTR
jgi:hypothetical protein